MLLAALLLVQAAQADHTAHAAAQADAACTSTDQILPPELAGWNRPADGFDVGKAVVLDAGDVTKLSGVPAGAKPGPAVMIGFRVAKAGSYGVALDQPGWIDVLPGASGGAALTSVKHGHGPACSSIRKVVRYELQPGLYRLYLTGLAKPQAKVMLVAPE